MLCDYTSCYCTYSYCNAYMNDVSNLDFLICDIQYYLIQDGSLAQYMENGHLNCLH